LHSIGINKALGSLQTSSGIFWVKFFDGGMGIKPDCNSVAIVSLWRKLQDNAITRKNEQGTSTITDDMVE
jgi:hypothetical protein